MDCNRFYFSPFYEEDNTSKILNLNIRTHIRNRYWGRKKTGLVHKEQLCSSDPKKKPPSCCWHGVVTCELDGCERDGGPAAQLIIGPLRRLAKKKKEKKNEAPFQLADDCSLLTEIERSFVERGKSDEGSVFTGRWTAAGRTDNGGKKKLIMGREGEGCLKGQAES